MRSRYLHIINAPFQKDWLGVLDKLGATGVNLFNEVQHLKREKSRHSAWMQDYGNEQWE